jgi:phage pi2 protein 07
MENKYPKLTLKDLTQGVNLSAKEILEYEKIVEKLNQIAEQNPEYIDYLRQRYPKSDPRLSQLRYKMDQMLSASEEYIETHFPENQKLFDKVQQSIKKSIKLTDPKTYKNTIDTPSFKKLLSVDYISQVDIPKKKIKLQNRNKKTAARFLKKPRIKSAMELIDAKIIELDKEMKKTGMST